MFNGIWLVAVEPLTIQGRTIAAGERFHLSKVHAGALLVTGRATIAHPQPPPKSHMPVPPPTPPPAPDPPRRRGRPRKADVVTETAVVDVPARQDAPVDISETAALIPEPVPDPLDVIETPRRYQRRDLEADE